MEGTAEVRAAVALAPARAASLSSGCIVTALTPHTQLLVAALLVLGARLGEKHNVCLRWSSTRGVQMKPLQGRLLLSDTLSYLDLVG